MNDLAIIKLDNARLALAECKTAMEAKQIADVAEAARVYLERTNASAETVNRATEIRLLAEKQMGEFLKAMPKATGYEYGGGGTRVDGTRDIPATKTPRLQDIGISKQQSSTAQKLASIPAGEFAERIAVAARELLEANSENQRSVKRANLTKIENCIRDGLFVLNGETIIISETGKLLNGQHRIIAVINTGIGIWTVLVEGIPDSYFPTIDSGSSRSFKDVLKIRGDANAYHVSSSISRLAEYLKSPLSVGSGTVFSNQELFDVRATAPDIIDSVRSVKNSAGRIIPVSRAAWLHYLANQECPQKCAEFFEALGSGLMLTAESPIYQLRNRLQNDRTGMAMPIREAMALLVKAWNAHASDKPMRVLRWAESEQFPRLLLPKE